MLGAGASCEALPLVNDMNIRIEIFLQFMRNSFNLKGYIFKLLPDDEPKVTQLFAEFDKMLSSMRSHFTPDTYAKKLFLSKKVSEPDKFKKFLNLYLIFEQSQLHELDYEAWDKTSRDFMEWKISYPSIYEYYSNDLLKKMLLKIDYRYDVFLSSLLHYESFTDNLILPSNYRILSWNYDNQLELAYKEFAKDSDFKDIKDILKIYKVKDEKKLSSRIMKLNGQNNYYDFENSKQIDFYTQFKSLIDESSLENDIYFAWENNNETLEEQLKHFANETDILVIIGYSFPYFNREIDSKFFKYFGPQKNNGISIFIQTPNQDEYEKIKLRIKIFYDYLVPDDVFMHIADCKQFFIP